MRTGCLSYSGGKFVADATDHRLRGTIGRSPSKGDEEKGEQRERSRNMPGGSSQSLILMDRPMSDGTRYNTLMNGRSILARSNAKSIFNYPSPSAFGLSINPTYDVYAGVELS